MERVLNQFLPSDIVKYCIMPCIVTDEAVIRAASQKCMKALKHLSNTRERWIVHQGEQLYFDWFDIKSRIRKAENFI